MRLSERLRSLERERPAWIVEEASEREQTMAREGTPFKCACGCYFEAAKGRHPVTGVFLDNPASYAIACDRCKKTLAPETFRHRAVYLIRQKHKAVVWQRGNKGLVGPDFKRA